MRWLSLFCLASLLSGTLAEGATRKQRKQVVRNKVHGTRREALWATVEKAKHPLSSVQRERELLDKHGRAVRDPQTGKTRRFDIAVISPTGRVSRLVEVTSPTADKRAQEAKTLRVLEKGPTYIADKRSGRLIRVRPAKVSDPVSWLRPTRIRTKRISLKSVAARAGGLTAAMGAGAWALTQHPGLLTSLSALF